jgi:hypothetical protein
LLKEETAQRSVDTRKSDDLVKVTLLKVSGSFACVTSVSARKIEGGK